MPSMKLWSVAVVVPVAAFAAVARADDAPQTEREKTLEQKVEELQKQVDDLTKRVSDGASRAGDEMAQSVSELVSASHLNKDGLFGYWNNGIRMDSADGVFKLKIGGRAQNDWGWFWNNERAQKWTGDNIEAGEEFRRARLYVGGTIYKNVDFMAEFDFAGGITKEREVWIGLNIPDVGHLQVGSFKEPFGFEELTSDLFTTFVERSAASEAFAPSYNTGMMLSGVCCDDMVAWQAGVFRDANDQGDDVGNTRSGEYNWTARVAGRPFVDADSEQYLHLGLGGSWRNPSDQMVRFRAHPEDHLAPYVADSFGTGANDVKELEAEAAYVSGPLHCEGDWYYADVTGDGGPNGILGGWQATVGWFLTGESRPYKASTATFDRVMPKHNFDDGDGMGAWEVAARYSRLDLHHGDFNGGMLNDMTFGVNWYLNPNTKVMLDWIRSHIAHAGVLNGIVARFQIDF
jgi:phosphate-selective porin OprO/OprP